MLCVVCMAFVGLVGCDTAKPEKFAGFASEQLSEQIESVSAKLDESIEENHLAQVEILRAVRDLSEAVAGMRLTSQEQIEELKKVSGKAKVKLTSSGDEKEGVATLDPNGAPSAKLQLDSLDDAAAQIEALTKQAEGKPDDGTTDGVAVLTDEQLAVAEKHRAFHAANFARLRDSVAAGDKNFPPLSPSSLHVLD